MPGVSRFDCYPSDFLNGVIGLSGDEIAVYTVVMMLQYDRGVAVPYVGHERELNVRSGLSKKRCASALDRLLQIGKLAMVDGCLSNPRAVKELEIISKRLQKNSENAKSGGQATREKWNAIAQNSEAKTIEINGDDKPIGLPSATPDATLPPSQPLGPTRARPSPSPSPSEEKSGAADREWNEIDAAIREPLGDKAPANFVIGPIVTIIREGVKLQTVVDILRSEAKRERRNPIRTWQTWADIVTERLAAPKANGHAGASVTPADSTVDMGGFPMKESDIVKLIEKHREPAYARMIEIDFGKVEYFRQKVAQRAPHLLKFWPAEPALAAAK